MAAAVAAGEKRAALPAAKIFARGEYYFINKDGHKVIGVDGTMMPLDSGTQMVTGPNSQIKILLPDETWFSLGPNSDMVIDEFVFDPATSSGALTANFAKATFRFVSGKHKIKTKIEMHSCEGGIRGTDFEAAIDLNGVGYIKLYEGKIDITNKKSGNTFELNTGQQITIAADGSISQPERFSH